MRGGTHARGLVCRCVDRKACLALFCEVMPAIVSRGKFQIDAGLLVVSRFVFDPQIRQRNLAVYYFQPCSWAICSRLASCSDWGNDLSFASSR